MLASKLRVVSLARQGGAGPSELMAAARAVRSPAGAMARQLAASSLTCQRGRSRWRRDRERDCRCEGPAPSRLTLFRCAAGAFA
jgi:hypothetical protein